MNPEPSVAASGLTIAAVERDTGLSKDTLRVWERRYGFPAPVRDASGERSYPAEQVEKLRVVKRLLDAGHRPGRTLPLTMSALQTLVVQAAEKAAIEPSRPADATDLRAHVQRLCGHDLAGLRRALQHQLSGLGVARFVVEVAAPLNTAIGEAWMRGEIEVFQEHAHTELMQGLLRQAIAGIPAPAADAGGPRVLLSTLPGEPHGLGLLMAEALLTLEGCVCVPLGPQTPVWDLVRAARAYRADIVALSHSGCLNPNQVVTYLAELAGRLDPGVQLWAGGSAPVLHRRPMPGVRALDSFDAMPGLLRVWREAQPPPAAKSAPA